MISLRLGPADLGRVRLVRRPHPVGTAVLASQVLPGAAAGPLRHLLPARGLVPDFVTPYQGLDSVEAGLDAIRSTPRRRVRADVARAYAHLPATPWRRRLAAGDRDAVELLAAALGEWFDATLRPQWGELALAHRRSVDRAAHRWAVSGVDGILGGLHPSVRWRPPVLQVDTWWSGELHGTGEGLLLAPSRYAGPRPRLLVEPGRPVLLVYPVPAPPTAPPGDPLPRLLGRTRAAVLRRLGEPGRHTTTALARAAGVSLPSVSEHATALRAAGLLTSEREGGAVVHRLTPLGVDLLGDTGGAPGDH
ncbi:ArsR/SmtB family transcription factor [Phytohabitans kaempferiae]|uniref:ArsR/SmtB family transcription factor n=1 Tax=Phytohabitans kaempferiae TaxID=1620943 RepID=A0ABV6MG96_9ACTN